MQRLRKTTTTSSTKMQNAEIAQLVEHNLAKVGVASSSLVFRSQDNQKVVFFFTISSHFSKNKSKSFLLLLQHHAKVAQSVEHQLPKLRVAGSSPVFRSKTKVSHLHA